MYIHVCVFPGVYIYIYIYMQLCTPHSPSFALNSSSPESQVSGTMPDDIYICIDRKIDR